MDYDALIVGSRVAGASLALLLGERGHRVLMVDRDAFPSDTLSTHFMARNGVVALERLGVLADVEAAGFRRITRARTWVEDLLFEGPAGPEGAYSLAPRRDVLDSTLIRHAIEHGGVEFQEQTHVEGLIEEHGRVVGATLRSSGGAPRRVRARASWSFRSPRHSDIIKFVVRKLAAIGFRIGVICLLLDTRRFSFP